MKDLYNAEEFVAAKNGGIPFLALNGNGRPKKQGTERKTYSDNESSMHKG